MSHSTDVVEKNTAEIGGFPTATADAPAVVAQIQGQSTQGKGQQAESSAIKEGQSQKPYSVWSRKEKWFVVALASFASSISPFTGTIYLPAMPTIATAFHTTVELINVTVTVYMVLQGICTSDVWGTLSDRYGRRPIFMGCLIVLTGSCIGLALTPTSAYWLLLFLRCVQAAGSASTVALGAGVIGDIAAPHERGIFFGVWNIGPMVGPSIGPILGGVLAGGLGWRSIFWFLCIFSAVCLLMIFLILPETLRAIVGNGSVPASKYQQPPIPIIGRKAHHESDYSTCGARRTFQNPLGLFLYYDVTMLLLYNAIPYSLYYAITASISSLFIGTYTYLDETEVGLCFLPIGIGMLIGGPLTGKLLDLQYHRYEEQTIRMIKECDGEDALPPDVTKEVYFPIERARLSLMPYYLSVFVACAIGYGWCLDAKVNIAGPLILTFVIGFSVVGIMNFAQTLIIDLVPSRSSSVTACNNLIRCSFGAVLVATINLMLTRLGAGWTYVLLALICVVLSPMTLVSIVMGPKWRAQRRARQDAVVTQ